MCSAESSEGCILRCYSRCPPSAGYLSVDQAEKIEWRRRRKHSEIPAGLHYCWGEEGEGVREEGREGGKNERKNKGGREGKKEQGSEGRKEGRGEERTRE